jgi:hypothetical protein
VTALVEPDQDPGEQVVLEIAPDPALVRTVRLVAAAVARRSGLDEDLVEEVRLAVGEACAVMIGTEDSEAPPDGDLEIRLRRGEGLQVEVSGSTGPQQEELSDLGLDPWAVLRGLFEHGSVEERAGGATVRLSWPGTTA